MLTKLQIARLKIVVGIAAKQKQTEIQQGFLTGLNPSMLANFEKNGFITREMRLRRPQDKQKVWFITVTDKARNFLDTL
jgi:hypothetical protein